MNRIPGSWKTPVALLVTMFVAWVASTAVARRDPLPESRTEMVVPAASAPERQPASNEIQDFPQLG